MGNDILSVLIIEDNVGDFILVEDFLIEIYKEIHVKRSIDFKAAEACLKQKEAYTVILLDLNLPDLSGIQLIDKITKLSNDTPVIVLTGYADVNMAKKSLELGISDFLIKDEINPSLLKKSIDFAHSRRNFISQIEFERENYKNLFNLSPQPMWLLHPENYKILDINEAAVENYGYSFDEFTAMSFSDLHPSEEKESLIGNLSENSAKVCSTRFTHLKKNGEHINVELSIKQMQSNSGSEGVIVQSTDITAIVNYIKTIELQNEKLKNIAWTQSHVVRAPLSRILGIIDLIESQKDSLDDLMFWLEQLRISSNEMDDVVKKIVDEAQDIQQDKTNE